MQMLRPFAPHVPTFTPGCWQEVVLVTVTLIVLPPPHQKRPAGSQRPSHAPVPG